MTSRTAPGCGPEWFENAIPGRSSPRSELNHPLHSDVLIVGAGSAGCVVAERFSADERCRVTVVEAGPGSSDPAGARDDHRRVGAADRGGKSAGAAV